MVGLASLLGNTPPTLSHIRAGKVMLSMTLQMPHVCYFSGFCPGAIPCLILSVSVPVIHCNHVYIRFQGEFSESL